MKYLYKDADEAVLVNIVHIGMHDYQYIRRPPNWMSLLHQQIARSQTALGGNWARPPLVTKDIVCKSQPPVSLCDRLADPA